MSDMMDMSDKPPEKAPCKYCGCPKDFCERLNEGCCESCGKDPYAHQ